MASSCKNRTILLLGRLADASRWHLPADESTKRDGALCQNKGVTGIGTIRAVFPDNGARWENLRFCQIMAETMPLFAENTEKRGEEGGRTVTSQKVRVKTRK